MPLTPQLRARERVSIIVDGTPSPAQDVLLAALEARDPGSLSRAWAVIDLADRVSIRLGLTDEGMKEVSLVAALHDVGRLAMPDSILFKPGPLSEAEEAIMREHTLVGADLVARVPALAHVAEPVRAIHERWDGEGWPNRLGGSMIPLAGRIVSVCVAYDAMTSPRPYRAAIDHETATREIARRAGTQFCPYCTEALLGVLAFEREAELV